MYLRLRAIYSTYCEANLKFNGKVKFAWQTCGKNVPTSKYLPIQAGTITGNTRFEVVSINQFGWFTQRDILNRPHKNYKMLLYIYVSGQSTVFELNLEFIFMKKLYIQPNRNEINLIDVDKNTCVTNSIDGCKLEIDKFSEDRAYKNTVLTTSMLNGWNQIGFLNNTRNTLYKFSIPGQNLIKYYSFIAWNTTLPDACVKRNQYVVQNLNKVNQFELNMDFTYGQMDGLNTALSCFREIASENNVNVTIDGAYTTKYTIAKFELSGERSAKNEFYKLLTDRTKSAKCIEYTCIGWYMDELEGNVTHAPIDNITHALDSVPKHSCLNTEHTHSSMQKLIVYIIVITVVALLLIAAGVFVFKTQQGKPQKDLFTDQSVLRKWTNEN